jgi:SAM-dependent methyltransferase
MTTLPSSPSLFSGRESHQARDMAESFGTNAERYDRSRPTYPRELIDRIAAASPGPEVLDVGIGTGIAARLFQAAGCRVLGVDPDERMADLARQRGFAVEVAKFEDWDPAGRAFDAVIAAQAWHWVDPVAGAAKAARVLRPAGRLALFWNAIEPPPDLAESFAAVHRRVLPDVQALHRAGPGLEAYGTFTAQTADGIRQAGVYGDVEQWHADWERPYTRDEWLDQIPTSGLAATLPPETLQEILVGIGAAIDAAGGSFVMRYRTVAVTAARGGAS